MLFLKGKTRSRERKSLNFKRSTKTFIHDTKDISNYIFCNTLSSVSIQHFYTNLFSPRRTLGLQLISKAELIIQTAHLHYRLPFNCYNPLGILQRVIKIKQVILFQSAVTNFSKTFPQIESIFIVSNQKDHDLGKRSSLYSKVLAKLSPRTQKFYQIPGIFWNPM